MSKARQTQTHPAGSRLYRAGNPGQAWRVVSGAVRLDRSGPGVEPMFANLAVEGDIIGAETLLFQHYTFDATTLADCVLSPWPEGDGTPAGESLLAALTASETRAADVVALRCGQALDRVKRLIALLGPRPDAPALPSRRDMADITALTTETVSRCISALRRTGMLPPDGQKRGRPQLSHQP